MKTIRIKKEVHKDLMRLKVELESAKSGSDVISILLQNDSAIKVLLEEHESGLTSSEYIVKRIKSFITAEEDDKIYFKNS